MRLWRWGAGAMLGAVALLVAGCGLFSPSESYRYRITVEVDTPQGLRSGSSVWETKATEGSGIPDTARRVRNRGEAVAVDLPGGTVLALLRDDDSGPDYPHYVVDKHLRAHPDPAVTLTPRWQQVMAAIRKAKPSFELYPDEYPLLVRFRDINDPASVEKIHPNLLSSSFGPGVHLKRIRIAVTNDNVTTGIEQVLPWLSRYRNEKRRLSGNQSVAIKTNGLAENLGTGDLSTEI